MICYSVRKYLTLRKLYIAVRGGVHITAHSKPHRETIVWSKNLQYMHYTEH